MSKPKTWEKQRAEAIEKELRSAWGAGWNRLGEEIRAALVAEKVLMLLLSQFGDQYQPAADMARGVLRESSHQLFGSDASA